MLRLPSSALVSCGALIPLVLVVSFAVGKRPLMVQPLVVPTVIRQPTPPDMLAFFSDRNKVRIVTPFQLTARDFIRIYQLEQTKDSVYKQLRASTGLELVAAGTTIEVELMPRLPPIGVPK